MATRKSSNRANRNAAAKAALPEINTLTKAQLADVGRRALAAMQAGELIARTPTRAVDPLLSRMLDEQDIIDQALSKAAGILFVFQQGIGKGEIESDKLTGSAVWAVQGFLDDAKQASERLDGMQRELWARVEAAERG